MSLKIHSKGFALCGKACPSEKIVLLYGTSYWNEIVNFQALVRHGMISQEDLGLFRFVDSPTEALDVLQRGLGAEMEAVTPAFAGSTTPIGSDGAARPGATPRPHDGGAR